MGRSSQPSLKNLLGCQNLVEQAIEFDIIIGQTEAALFQAIEFDKIIGQTETALFRQ